MKELYKVVEIEEMGFKSIGIVAIVEAKDPLDARTIAARELKNPEIITTGFYDGRKITRDDWVEKIRAAHNKLAILRNILT